MFLLLFTGGGSDRRERRKGGVSPPPSAGGSAAGGVVDAALAQGERLRDILHRLGHVAEGVYTAREVAQLALAQKVDMPITTAVCRVLHQDIPAAQALQELLSREPKAELSPN